ncbi:uncharacterized protein LOC131928990 [Physella acuta]|uniref:uncharacterized protein LOC131928990 n=1 Tax=Physella acuta TaxID=109671 RepID=UPI0027DB3988|nr:uncharacterized protein LOC131928990 [Physella acuta]
MPVQPEGFRAGLVYFILLLAIPLQYYLSSNASVPSGQRDAIFKRLVGSLSNFQYKYLSVTSWKRWCSNVWQTVDGWRNGRGIFVSDADEERGESPALDILRIRNPYGYFATSTNIRSPRQLQVHYRVGQVIRHKIHGYKGVIIGWDLEAQAPEEWLRQNHPVNKPHWRKMPHYAILVDVKDRPEKQITYVPQENIEVITHTEISHPSLDTYFDSFDGAQYLMRPALKYLYPRD